jgi:hypothetical protein
MPSDMFYLLLIVSWTLVASIFNMWAYGATDAAYKYGKLVVVFLIGVVLGIAVA